jgi:hypothetical protein
MRMLSLNADNVRGPVAPATLAGLGASMRLTLFALSALTACTPEAATSPYSEQTDPTAQRDVGAVAIATPAEDGRVYAAGDVTWSVETVEMNAEALTSDVAEAQGEGHVHVYLDGALVADTADASYSFSGLEVGRHEAMVVLATNQHREFGYASIVGFDVIAPTITLTSPDASAADTEWGTADVHATVSISEDFAVEDQVDEANAVGTGHVHLYVDGVYVGLSTDPEEIWFDNLSPGTHVVGVQLAQNDHSALPDDAVSEATVTVAGDALDAELDALPYADGMDSASWPIGVSVVNGDLEGWQLYVDGKYTAAGEDASSWLLHGEPGDHTLTLVLTDGTDPISARDTVSFTCAADRPDITIDDPSDGDEVDDSFTVSVTAENFTLDADSAGQENATDVGHFHVLIDGGYAALGGADGAEVSGLSSGDHTLTTVLVANDHSDLDPIVFDEIAITVR